MLTGHGFEQSLLIAKMIDAQAAEVVKHGLNAGRSGYLWLASRGGECRRKRSDQISFVILCIAFAIGRPGKRRTK